MGANPQVMANVTQEEIALLESRYNAMTNLDTIKITRDEMNELLLKYTGFALEETNKKDLDNFYYLEEFDSYYVCRGDTSYQKYEFYNGWINGGDGTITLRYKGINGDTRRVTLLELDGNIYFMSNLKETETGEAGLFEFAKTLPNYEITKIELDDLVDREGRRFYDTQIGVLDDSIFLFCTEYDKENNRFYCFYTFNYKGENLKRVVLEEPVYEEDGYLERFMVGGDGRIYAYKVEKGITLWSCFDEICSIISWDMNGKIMSEVKFQEPEEGYGEDSYYWAWIESISESGEFCCEVSNYYRAVTLHVSAEGESLTLHQSVDMGAFNEFWANYDDTFAWIYMTGRRDDTYDQFYITYDINKQEFSERIQIHDNIMLGNIYGDRKDAIFVEYDRYLYRYYPFTGEIEVLAYLEKTYRDVWDVYPISETDFAVFVRDSEEYVYWLDSIYVYTLVADGEKEVESTVMPQGVTPLSEAEMDYFATEFFNNQEEYLTNLILGEEFATIKELDLENVFRYGTMEEAKLTLQEQRQLSERYHMNLTYHIYKYTFEEADALLQKYLGAGVLDVDEKGISNNIYLEEFDAYYMNSGNKPSYYNYNFLDGWTNPDETVTLRYERGTGEVFRVTLRVVDGRYCIVSNVEE